MFLILLPNTFCLSWNILIFVLGVAWNYKLMTLKGKLNVVPSPALMSVLLNRPSSRMEHIFTDVSSGLAAWKKNPSLELWILPLHFLLLKRLGHIHSSWTISEYSLAPLAVLTDYMFTNHTILDMFFSN